MSDTVKCCPHCGSTGIRNRISTEYEHYCRDCQDGFDDLEERPRQGNEGVKAKTMIKRALGDD